MSGVDGLRPRRTFRSFLLLQMRIPIVSMWCSEHIGEGNVEVEFASVSGLVLARLELDDDIGR